ncbi:MAG: CHAD domain-containing protein [Microbacterium pygmaeum]
MQENPPSAARTSPLAQAMDELARRFDETDRELVSDRPDGIHRHRTVVRRIRSLLAAYRRLLEVPGSTALAGELQAWGTSLGVARDAEVRAEQLAEALCRDGDTPAARALVESRRASSDAASRRLREVHDLERTTRMRALLDEFVLALRADEEADASPRSIRRRIRGEAERTVKRAAGADGSLESYHRLRKSARRLRHAVEAVTDDPPGLFGARIRRLGRRAHRIHGLLGDHRDAVLLADELEHEAGLAQHRGEEATDLEAAAARARANATEILAGLDQARRKLDRAAHDLD